MNKKIINYATKIFKNSSKTYFNSAKFFPADIRDEVTVLYSFVRTADDLVDQKNPQIENFHSFKQSFIDCLNGKKTNDLIIDPFVELLTKKQIEKDLPLKFLNAMEQDLTKSTYQNIDELKEYMDGSAEVIGLMLSRIMQLPKKADLYARMLGRSMQFINFIRDINHDLSLNRVYIPQNLLKKYHLQSLEYKIVSKSQNEFIQLIKSLLKQYENWQQEAEKGFSFIPREYLIPIKTASDMYKWTGEQIAANPLIIYQKRIKPTKLQILATIEENKKL